MIEPSCRVHINWKNFCSNIALLQKKGKPIMPVIKADAYGHGVLGAAEKLESMGIHWAAVGTPEEGAQVRDHGFSGYIVALLSRVPDAACIQLALEKHITLLIHNSQGLSSTVQIMHHLSPKIPLSIAVKVDTGMSRLGFRLKDIPQLAETLSRNPMIQPVLQLSHFAVADVPEEQEYTEQQADIFFKAADILHQYFPAMLCSLGNTAGLLCHTEHSGDLCRPGISLYGYNPMHGTSKDADGQGFLPVMEVSAPLLSVHSLHKGESLGYGRIYTAPSERIVGWVAIGYADGYRRNPAPGTCMCINGIRVPVIGRVAMQMTCIDLTDLPCIPSPGDTVYVMGGPGNAVSAQNLADWWGTIPYEVTCLLGKNRLTI
jgi:alanine racemase